MSLDPDIAAYLQNIALHTPPADWSHGHDPVATARFLHERKAALVTPPQQRSAVAGVEDQSIPGPGGPVKIRIYHPLLPLNQGNPPPLVLWMHGGGWMTGSLETGDILARAVCEALHAVVISVDYRLAPEHPWPAGLNDCTAALEWVTAHAAELGADPERIIVGGDSAGGNLAAVVAQTAAPKTTLIGQLLLYPAVDLDTNADYRFPSRMEKADGYGLGLDEIRTCYRVYPAGAYSAHPKISPLRAATFVGLPPAVIAVAQHDPLRDEGCAYAESLEAAGVPVVFHEGLGLVHGCFDMLSLSPAAADELDRVLDSATTLFHLNEPIAEI